jgi:hypothetical protein
MKNNCDVVTDLLPLYVDGVCSEESKKLVEEHLEECEACRNASRMLQEDITIQQDHDVNIIKGVKRRIFIEKIVLAIIAVVVAGSILICGGIYMLSSYVPMTEVSLKDTVSVSQDEDGNVWLIRNGMTTDAKGIMSEQYNTEGELISSFANMEINSGVDNSHVIYQVVLYETRITKLSHKLLGDNAVLQQEQSILFNANEKTNYDKVVVVEDGQETVLWER